MNNTLMFRIPDNVSKEEKIHYIMMIQKDFLSSISSISDCMTMKELKDTIKEFRQWKELNKTVLEEICY